MKRLATATTSGAVRRLCPHLTRRSHVLRSMTPGALSYGQQQRWHGHSHGDATQDITNERDKRRALIVTNAGAALNLALAGAKAVVGTMCHSPALIADAVHSLSDLASDVATVITVSLARKPADADHPYGHGKIETLGALTVSAMLVGAGIGIGYHAYIHLFEALALLELAEVEAAESQLASGHTHGLTLADFAGMSGLALAVAGVSVGAKELLFRWTLNVGEQLHSQVLIANAWHHRSDALSSVVAFGGIGASMAGFPFLDPVAGMMVGAMIIKAGGSIGLTALQELTDQSMDEQLVKEVGTMVASHDDVKAFSRLRIRHMGHYVLVDMEIEVDPVMSVSAAHQVAEQVRYTVLNEWPKIAEVMIAVRAHERKRGKSQRYRPVGEIENDLKSTAMSVHGVNNISHIRLHFLRGKLMVEMEISVDSAHTVEHAARVAVAVKAATERISDVHSVDVHLELLGH